MTIGESPPSRDWLKKAKQTLCPCHDSANSVTIPVEHSLPSLHHGVASIMRSELVPRSVYRRLRRDFESEMQAVVYLRHPNIVTAMGAVMGEEPLMVRPPKARRPAATSRGGASARRAGRAPLSDGRAGFRPPLCVRGIGRRYRSIATPGLKRGVGSRAEAVS